MGQPCLQCKPINQYQIQSNTIQLNKSDKDKKSLCDTEFKSSDIKTSDENHSREKKEDTLKQNINNYNNKKNRKNNSSKKSLSQIEEKKMLSTKYLNAPINSYVLSTKNFDQGRPISNFPDYFTQENKQKLQKTLFQYKRNQFQQSDAQQHPPLQFQQRYVYQGQWKNKMRNGRGKQIWKDGSYYQGYWLNNQAHGYGRFINSQGGIYIGQLNDNKPSGYGIYQYPSKVIYKGIWKNGKQQDYGQQIWPSFIYKGNYTKGKKNGKGRLIWSDDSCYEGQFQDNKFNGNGTYVWANGSSYSGQWLNNYFDGKGKFRWPEGRVYQGGYKKGKKHGNGVIRWPNGKQYNCYWIEGKEQKKLISKSSGRLTISQKQDQNEGVQQNSIILF